MDVVRGDKNHGAEKYFSFLYMWFSFIIKQFLVHAANVLWMCFVGTRTMA